MGDPPASEAHSTKTVLNDLRFEECVFAVIEPPNSSCAEHLPNLFHSQDLKKWLPYFVKSQIPLSSLLHALKHVIFVAFDSWCCGNQSCVVEIMCVFQCLCCRKLLCWFKGGSTIP